MADPKAGARTSVLFAWDRIRLVLNNPFLLTFFVGVAAFLNSSEIFSILDDHNSAESWIGPTYGSTSDIYSRLGAALFLTGAISYFFAMLIYLFRCPPMVAYYENRAEYLANRATVRAYVECVGATLPDSPISNDRENAMTRYKQNWIDANQDHPLSRLIVGFFLVLHLTLFALMTIFFALSPQSPLL